MDVYQAIADPTRRAVLDELCGKSGQTLFELCSRLSQRHHVALTRQAISQHLSVLEEAGLVVSRREGRYRFLDVDLTPLAEIVRRWPIPRST
jgi:DNA-binding transcriptional ArsR family regulator